MDPFVDLIGHFASRKRPRHDNSAVAHMADDGDPTRRCRSADFA
jgi:hypothetical protein